MGSVLGAGLGFARLVLVGGKGTGVERPRGWPLGSGCCRDFGWGVSMRGSEALSSSGFAIESQASAPIGYSYEPGQPYTASEKAEG